MSFVFWLGLYKEIFCIQEIKLTYFNLNNLKKMKHQIKTRQIYSYKSLFNVSFWPHKNIPRNHQISAINGIQNHQNIQQILYQNVLHKISSFSLKYNFLSICLVPVIYGFTYVKISRQLNYQFALAMLIEHREAKLLTCVPLTNWVRTY